MKTCAAHKNLTNMINVQIFDEFADILRFPVQVFF